jgi:hypothetical protein
MLSPNCNLMIMEKLRSKGDYSDPITKNISNKEHCHATLVINSVGYEVKYPFVRK